MTKEEAHFCYDVMSKAWKAFLECAVKAEDTDAFWDSVVDTFTPLAIEYHDTEYYDFVRDISMAFFGKLEQIAKRKVEETPEAI